MPESRRVGNVTIDELKRLSAHLDGLRGEIDTCVKRMEISKIKHVTIDGITKPRRGLDLLSEFEADVEKAIKHLTRFGQK